MFKTRLKQKNNFFQFFMVDKRYHCSSLNTSWIRFFPDFSGFQNFRTMLVTVQNFLSSQSQICKISIIHKFILLKIFDFEGKKHFFFVENWSKKKHCFKQKKRFKRLKRLKLGFSFFLFFKRVLNTVLNTVLNNFVLNIDTLQKCFSYEFEVAITESDVGFSIESVFQNSENLPKMSNFSKFQNWKTVEGARF